MSATKVTYLSPDAKKRLVHRLNRATGHLNAIKKMLEDDRCADDVLIQVAAARSAVGKIGAKILEEHLVDCMTTCMDGTPEERARRVSKAVTTLLKN